jgi:hypothetical protein
MATTAAETTTYETTTRAVGRAARITGRVLTVLLTLFLLFDSVTKLMQLPPVVDATVQMGFPAATVPVIGGVLLVCLALYLVPRTSVLGAVLLTGYLGGAVSAQLRIEAPLFSNTLFPIYVGVVVWGALYVRNATLRTLVRSSLS